MIVDLPLVTGGWLAFAGNVASIVGLGISSFALRAAASAARACFY
jgi:hypothetical protein